MQSSLDGLLRKLSVNHCIEALSLTFEPNNPRIRDICSKAEQADSQLLEVVDNEEGEEEEASKNAGSSIGGGRFGGAILHSGALFLLHPVDVSPGMEQFRHFKEKK